MTIQQILDCSAEQLESMSDKELEEYFKQFYPTTRPEYVKKKEKQTKGKQLANKFEMQQKKKNAIAILNQLGFDGDDVLG